MQEEDLQPAMQLRVEGLCNPQELWVGDRNYGHLVLWTLSAIRMFSFDNICKILSYRALQKCTLFQLRKQM